MVVTVVMIAGFKRIFQTLLLYNLILFVECYYGIIGTVTYAYKQKVRI